MNEGLMNAHVNEFWRGLQVPTGKRESVGWAVKVYMHAVRWDGSIVPGTAGTYCFERV